MVEPEVRRRHRLLAAAIVVAHMSMLTALDVLNLMNLAPAPPSFAVSAIVYHLPAMWGVFQIVPMFRARLVSIGGLVRLGLRGLLSDTFVLALLFLPSLYLIGRMGGDFVTPATHLATCLLIASVLRVAWIPLVAYQCESINASVAMFAGMIGFFVVVMMMGVIRFFFGWAADELMFVVPLWVGGLVLVLGWDRVAARIHPHVPALREIWRKMNAPLGMSGH